MTKPKFGKVSKNIKILCHESRGTNPYVTIVLHAWVYGRFTEIQSNLRRKKLYKMKEAVLEAVLAIEIM